MSTQNNQEPVFWKHPVIVAAIIGATATIVAAVIAQGKIFTREQAQASAQQPNTPDNISSQTTRQGADRATRTIPNYSATSTTQPVTVPTPPSAHFPGTPAQAALGYTVTYLSSTKIAVTANKWSVFVEFISNNYHLSDHMSGEVVRKKEILVVPGHPLILNFDKSRSYYNFVFKVGNKLYGRHHPIGDY